MAKRSSVPTRRVLLPKPETAADRAKSLVEQLDAIADEMREIAARITRIGLLVSISPEAG